MKIPADLLALMTAATLAGCASHAAVRPAPASVAPEVEQAGDTAEAAAAEEEHPKVSADDCPPCGMG